MGIYVYMSLHVTSMLVKLFLFFATVLVGFALSFHLLLPGYLAFSDPVTSGLKVYFSTISDASILLELLKVMVMMSGEFEFEDNFISDSGVPQFVFLIFFFAVSIVIANLLLGMTVNKTEELLKLAKGIKLEKMVYQVLGVEHIIHQDNVVKKLMGRSMRRLLERKSQIFSHLEAIHKKGKFQLIQTRNLPF